MATVELMSAAREDLKDLDRSAQKQVLRALKKLETEPEQRGAPLGHRNSGNLTGFRKLVVGDRDYRVIYKVEKSVVVVVWVIAQRADGKCYDLALSRLRLFETDPGVRQELINLLDTVYATAEER